MIAMGMNHPPGVLWNKHRDVLVSDRPMARERDGEREGGKLYVLVHPVSGGAQPVLDAALVHQEEQQEDEHRERQDERHCIRRAEH